MIRALNIYIFALGAHTKYVYAAWQAVHSRQFRTFGILVQNEVASGKSVQETRILVMQGNFNIKVRWLAIQLLGLYVS
jgi:hypothetical protein